MNILLCEQSMSDKAVKKESLSAQQKTPWKLISTVFFIRSNFPNDADRGLLFDYKQGALQKERLQNSLC